ncbi:N-acetylneuraminate synthase [Thiomicrorhabdus sediminis]|uniref:N-acetylneuraminate synthase n=1 Tax=Thiomicrorhabdus sediminis TaxID=2580412 RepID=A0A4P9K6H0_9GAMM|nr:N-acetylneuraminate synthase [Thiomicrorhabdus sediminis]QCU90478.1 N-acetylneuraminate synthase [Thiomicrorhabdus sediminis]
MHTFIIAEAGVNHNGDLDKAMALIDAAVDAGADAVKFQTFNTENLVTEDAKQADYQAANTGVKESQFAMLKRLELSVEAHQQLFAYCQQKNIEFISTAFDSDSVEFLHQLGMKRWKIPSGELLSIPYLRQIARFNQPTILSTGMGDLGEVNLAITTLLDAGLSKQNLIVLHANTAYPTPYSDVNLRAMQTIEAEFDVSVGLSDHSLGIEVPIAAVAMGAQVIEKHFTLDRTLPGPDHKASLEPQELKQMVISVRHIEQALGDGKKQSSVSEKANISVARKRIVAKSAIQKGEQFSEQNVTLKRSGQGAYASDWDNVIGQTANQNFAEGEGIE